MSLGDLALELSQSGGIPLISAFLIGVLVSISPCPMATNIAAIAYVSRRVTERKYAVTVASLYTVGRMFSYSIIGILIIVVGFGITGIATFLQDVGEQWLGPLLIVVGLLLLGALVRVVLPLIAVAHYTLWIGLSQLLWVAAFVVFLVVYTPILVKPRLE